MALEGHSTTRRQQRPQTPETLVLCIRPDGAIEGLYDDDLRLDELGRLEIRRASSVEFDDATGEWVATTPSGQIIARDRSRAACIRKEIEFFQAAFRRGFRVF